jgi:YegS/Rv2252/BmrU family lipid kinase
MRRIVAICNSSAGSADDDALARALASLREGADVAVATVDGPDEIHAVLERHPDRDPVAVGGDGTLHCLVDAVVRRDELTSRTVGLIPLGTGNDFARTLGLPTDPDAAARIVLGGRERWMDLLVDDAGGIVVNAVHLGIGADASQTATPLKPFLRRLAYMVGSLVAGVRSRGWRERIEVDGQVVANGRRRVLMIAVGNGTSIGGGTPLTPDARPDDGKADVVVSYATGPLQRLRYGMLLRRGRHGDHDQVMTLRGSRIEVSGEAIPVNADGELAEPITSRTWQVRPRAWRIVVPEGDGP